MPVPTAQERPCAFAERVGAWYLASKSSEYRKAHGLYLTPVPIADFMAARIGVSGEKLRLLDPAAGAGVLCCAAVEHLAAQAPVPASVELVAYEDDASLRQPLEAVLSYLADWCRAHRIRLEVNIETADFIAAQAGALRSLQELFPADSAIGNFDAVIANPPYFKIGRNDPRALAAPSVVHGQPNIYALFMAVGAATLRPSGEFVYIVPRSFASGPYFRQFRSTFFQLMQPSAIHAFDSRRSAFSRDDILQENVIFAGRRRDGWLRNGTGGMLTISSSHGVADIETPTQHLAPVASVVNPQDPDTVLRLPLSDADASVLELVEGWPCTLRDLGLGISTGPVVPFRATSSVCADGDVPATHAPLLWMNHVRPLQATWPLRRHKKEYLLRDGAERLLVPNRNYVLIRRFSAKEETRRLTAAPYIAKRFGCSDLGLENHLNYIHRPNGTLLEDEAWGLAALYSSRLLDRYFRCINGNTQVSATELRAMRLPSASVIAALGCRVRQLADPLAVLDDLIMEITASPRMAPKEGRYGTLKCFKRLPKPSPAAAALARERTPASHLPARCSRRCGSA